MKIVRGVIKAVFFILLAACIFIFSAIIYLDSVLGGEYKVNRGELLNIESVLPVTAEFSGESAADAHLRESVGRASVELKLFGTIPFSTAEVEYVDKTSVAVLGNPFGIKLYTNGVLVIDITSVATEKGNESPAAVCGVKKGDYILTANGKEITCNEDLAEIVADSAGREIAMLISRNGEKKNIKVTPLLSSETKNYQIGIWVRDSTAGIGTLTFYSPSSGVICGLGHGICDSDTGSLLTVDSGQMVTAAIAAVEKGKNGSPGELKGSFKSQVLADISENSEIGVYGILSGNIGAAPLTEIALRQEVENGEAQLLCTIDGEEPKLYSCTVKKRNAGEHSKTQNLLVTVTDPQLIKATGGIVQGMSGSPILQNGKLIGAVTHVLIDDSTTGYGIYAENMLKNTEKIAEMQLKDAS